MALYARAKDNNGAGDDNRGGRRWRRLRYRMLLAAIALPAVVYVTGLLINLGAGRMRGFNVVSELTPVNPGNLRIYFDLTGVDRDGERVTEHETFDALLEMIAEAEREIVLDLFLVNRYHFDRSTPFYRDTSQELVDALVESRRRHPDIFILFVTDMINSGYQESCPPALLPLVEAGGHVVLTDLHQLPDSNFVYSPFYRVLRHLGWLAGPVIDRRFLPNPFDPEAERFSLRQMSRALNFKANHRKVAAVRRADGRWSAMVGSGNPHSASSAHGNLAVILDNEGPIHDIVFSEYNLARASLLRRPQLYFGPDTATELVRELERRVRQWPAMPPLYDGEDGVMVQYLSELEVARRLDRMLATADSGDRIEMMMFYLSDPKVIEGLRAAAERGAQLRLLLDPNIDAFGRNKHGVPNRVTAHRLLGWAEAEAGRDVRVRWFLTHGEQAHFKVIRLINRHTGHERMLVGSANFTVRNLRGQNLESAFYLENARSLGVRYGEVFERLWDNCDDVLYTVGFQAYQSSGWRLAIMRAMKFIGNRSGLCTY